LNGIRQDIPIGPDRYLYECADGAWVAVASAEPRTWNALCRGLGLDDLVDTLHRWEDAPAVVARLAAAFATRPAAEWVTELTGLGAAVVNANRGEELGRDPHITARGSLQDVGGVVTPRNPVRFRDTEQELSRDAPQPPSSPGADTIEILSGAGFGADEIAALRSDGVISSA
ncbi:MAG TPA: CoA transferase, partial [Ilumatobacteraceae bacterium]